MALYTWQLSYSRQNKAGTSCIILMVCNPGSKIVTMCLLDVWHGLHEYRVCLIGSVTAGLFTASDPVWLCGYCSASWPRWAPRAAGSLLALQGFAAPTEEDRPRGLAASFNVVSCFTVYLTREWHRQDLSTAVITAHYNLSWHWLKQARVTPRGR